MGNPPSWIVTHRASNSVLSVLLPLIVYLLNLRAYFYRTVQNKCYLDNSIPVAKLPIIGSVEFLLQDYLAFSSDVAGNSMK